MRLTFALESNMLYIPGQWSFTSQIYANENSNIVAYSMNRQAPLPYRIKSSVLSFQIPGLNRFQTWASGIKFLQNMQQTTTWKVIAGSLFTIRTWSRRTIWGDRVCIQSPVRWQKLIYLSCFFNFKAQLQSFYRHEALELETFSQREK